jgi:hypothetical protein
MSEGWELVAAAMIGVVVGAVLTLIVVYCTSEGE